VAIFPCEGMRDPQSEAAWRRRSKRVMGVKSRGSTVGAICRKSNAGCGRRAGAWPIADPVYRIIYIMENSIRFGASF
jgi:hypothetical protein